ncbi:MAG: hypothetical protein RLY14_3303, partial [Planctomycetota bacterium]
MVQLLEEAVFDCRFGAVILQRTIRQLSMIGKGGALTALILRIV